MTEEEIIHVETLNLYQELGIDVEWVKSLPGYVGLYFEDIIVHEGERNVEFDEGEESPYILEFPVYYGESLYKIYFNGREALHNAAKLFEERYCSIDGKIVGDEDKQEDINEMSEEEFGEWKAKQEKSFEELKLRKKLEQDAQRRAWIGIHGSNQLKQIVTAGDDYEMLYLIEKGAKLLGKEYVMDYKRKVISKLRQHPSPEAKEEEERLNQNKELNPNPPLRVARAVWIPKDRLEAIEVEIEGVNFYKKIKTIKPDFANSIRTKRTKMILFMKDGVPHSLDEVATVAGTDAYRILHTLKRRGWISENYYRYTLDLKNKEVLNFLGISDGDVKCNNCHSKNIVKWGKKQCTIGLRQVWKCKDCGHKFQTTGEGAEINK